MGSFTYENQGIHTYLVYTLEEDETLDSMSLGMITNNEIPGLASAMFMQMNAERYMKYNISSKIPASQFFTGPVNKKRLLGVFGGIADAMLSAEEYMIDANTILLDLDYIYADVASGSTVLICIPVGTCEKSGTDLGTFFKQIMFSTQFDQTENCEHVTRIINYLNSAYLFSLADFKALLEELTQTAMGTGSQMGTAGAGRGVNQAQFSGNGQPGNQGQMMGTGQSVRQSAGQIPAAVGGQATGQMVGNGQAASQGQAAGQSRPMSPGQPAGTGQIPIHGAVQQSVQTPLPGAGPQRIQPTVSGMGQPGFSGNVQTVPSTSTGPENMSLLYLLRHYDKENASIYKAQKAEKKSQKPPKDKKASKKEKGSKGAKAAPQFSGFAIPGQDVPPPIPGASSAYQTQQEKIPVQIPQPGIPNHPQVQKPVAQSLGIPMPSIMGQSQQIPAQQMSSIQSSSMSAGCTGTGANFGDTVFADSGEEDTATVMMGQGTSEQQIRPHLIRKRNNEKIFLNRALFRLGRNREFNDYVIGENDFIGNTHCHILTRSEEFFIVDDNSKNHTYVDHVMVLPGNEVKLVHGQTIRLADEEFEFRLF